MSENESFDYVIIGGGTAGCILTRRLTEDGKSDGLPDRGGPAGQAVR